MLSLWCELLHKLSICTLKRFVNLKCVTYAQPIPLPLIVSSLWFTGITLQIILNKHLQIIVQRTLNTLFHLLWSE